MFVPALGEYLMNCPFYPPPPIHTLVDPDHLTAVPPVAQQHHNTLRAVSTAQKVMWLRLSVLTL